MEYRAAKAIYELGTRQKETPHDVHQYLTTNVVDWNRHLAAYVATATSPGGFKKLSALEALQWMESTFNNRPILEALAQELIERKEFCPPSADED